MKIRISLKYRISYEVSLNIVIEGVYRKVLKSRFTCVGYRLYHCVSEILVMCCWMHIVEDQCGVRCGGKYHIPERERESCKCLISYRYIPGFVAITTILVLIN